MSDLKPKCLQGCYYFGFSKLHRACFHPDRPRLLMGASAMCSLYEDQEHKALPGHEPDWKPVLTFREFDERVYRGHENSEAKGERAQD